MYLAKVGGPLFAMWYLRLLSWTALGSAAAAGCLAAALAAWATRGTGGKAPVCCCPFAFTPAPSPAQNLSSLENPHPIPVHAQGR